MSSLQPAATMPALTSLSQQPLLKSPGRLLSHHFAEASPATCLAGKESTASLSCEERGVGWRWGRGEGRRGVRPVVVAVGGGRGGRRRGGMRGSGGGRGGPTWRLKSMERDFDFIPDFDEKDEEYVEASVLDAIEVKSGIEGLLIRMVDGKYLTCQHNTPNTHIIPDYSPNPAIVLQLLDASNILLPIVVLELPCITLVEAMQRVPMARPTVYQVMRDMIELMGYEIKLVRVTHRVYEAYFARLYVEKVGQEERGVISFDMRPSDAINMAVRAKVPIQVSRSLAVSDGVRPVNRGARVGKRAVRQRSQKYVMSEEDVVDEQPCTAAEELTLILLLEKAAKEERYRDAAMLRDEIQRLRQARDLL